MQLKAGDKVYWNGKKWEIFLMWNDTSSKAPVCCLLNIITGETVDTFVSSLKPILRAKK